MESYLKESLGYSFVKRSGQGGGGCISQGEMYHTDQGQIFVKENSKEGADKMFKGEYESLKAIANTNTIKVPQPIKVLKRPTGKIYSETSCVWAANRLGFGAGAELLKLSSYDVW